jgi:predicted DNA-binding transcriptional regulator YafY
MKASRLLEILLRLQAHSPQSARVLAKALEVAQRTIYRDVEALSTAGVPVFASRGVNGGIHLLEGYRKSISRFSDQEIRTLFVGLSDPLADLGWGGQAGSARGKLFAALTDVQRREASTANNRILIESSRWMQSAQPTPLLKMLREAIWDQHRIKARYRNQTGSITLQTLNPLGLVFKAGIWYLVAASQLRIRTFRVDRMSRIRLGNETFSCPSDFKLAEYWEESSRRYEKTASPITVRVEGSKRHLRHLAAWWPSSRARSVGSSRWMAEVTFPLRGQAVHELLAWSAEIVVVEPKDVRDEIIERLNAARRRYHS